MLYGAPSNAVCLRNSEYEVNHARSISGFDFWVESKLSEERILLSISGPDVRVFQCPTTSQVAQVNAASKFLFPQSGVASLVSILS